MRSLNPPLHKLFHLNFCELKGGKIHGSWEERLQYSASTKLVVILEKLVESHSFLHHFAFNLVHDFFEAVVAQVRQVFLVCEFQLF